MASFPNVVTRLGQESFSTAALLQLLSFAIGIRRQRQDRLLRTLRLDALIGLWSTACIGVRDQLFNLLAENSGIGEAFRDYANLRKVRLGQGLERDGLQAVRKCRKSLRL